MTAYWMDRVKVGDEAEYDRYRQAAYDVMAEVKPRLISLDARREVLEGPDDFDRLGIIAFPTFDRAREVYASPGYQASVQIRQASGAVNELVAVDGVEGAPHDEKFGAYWVAFVQRHDPEQYQKYVDAAAALLPHTPAKVLVGGGRYEAMESPSGCDRFILVGWPTFDEAVAQFHSEGYKAAAAHRRSGAGDVWIAVVEAAGPAPWE